MTAAVVAVVAVGSCAVFVAVAAVVVAVSVLVPTALASNGPRRPSVFIVRSFFLPVYSIRI